MCLKTSIHKLMQKQNLDQITCQQALNDMLAPDANPLQTAAFLVLLRSKTETADELVGLIKALHHNMIPVITPHKVLDIVGTGGDNENTINISTGGAILAASCGVKIAKHGNRAITSLAGSADVLEALGVNIHLTPEKISASIDELGIGFCYSPNFHPAFRELRSLRKQLNIPTSLNILGPLLNPTDPKHIILGTFDATLSNLLAQTLRKMGTERSVVVHGCGIDEISCVGQTTLIEVTQTTTTQTIITPEQFGLSRCSINDLQGADAKVNAERLILALSTHHSNKVKAIADTLILNAAVALYLYGLYPSIQESITHARDNLRSGHALSLLNKWIELSQDLKCPSHGSKNPND